MQTPFWHNGTLGLQFQLNTLAVMQDNFTTRNETDEVFFFFTLFLLFMHF